MATIKLYLDKRSKRIDGTSAIRLAVNNHGQTAFITLGQHVKEDEWDKKLCRVKKRPDKDAINDFLLDRLCFYNRILMQLQCKPTYHNNISAIALRDMILDEANPNSKFVTLKDMFNRYLAREMKQSTKINYTATWHTIEQYEKHHDTITLEEINRDWVEKYNLFLINLGRCNNTRTTRIRHIESVFNYAIDNELTRNYPFRRIKLKIEETQKRDLNVEDLRNVFATTLPKKKQWVIDTFRIIFCLIGINLQDLYNLTPASIIDGRIEYVRLKTNKKYSILIQPELQDLINMYNGKKKLFSFCEKYRTYNSFNNVVNRNLRTLREGLTTYYARHTWATLAFKIGISKDIISLALGHSFGMRVTSTYIHTDLIKVDEANRKVLDYVLCK